MTETAQEKAKAAEEAIYRLANTYRRGFLMFGVAVPMQALHVAVYGFILSLGFEWSEALALVIQVAILVWWVILTRGNWRSYVESRRVDLLYQQCKRSTNRSFLQHALEQIEAFCSTRYCWWSGRMR